MKKRFVAALVSAVMTVAGAVSLSACGGKTSEFDGNKNVTVVVREDGSGTKAAVMELLGLKGKADKGGVIVASSTAAVMVEVENNKYAIAYDSLGYVTGEVKKLKVDGVAPSAETVKSGEYKISRPLSVVYKESALEKPLNAAYFEFLKSAEAEKIMTELGYVWTADNAPAYQVKSGLTGTINLSGSTSFEDPMVVLAEKFMSLQSGVTVNVAGGGSGTGYKNAGGDVSDFGMISEVFNSEKAPSCVSYAVSFDGIALIVNKDNPGDNVTKEELKNIYDKDAGDNEIKEWASIADFKE